MPKWNEEQTDTPSSGLPEPVQLTKAMTVEPARFDYEPVRVGSASLSLDPNFPPIPMQSASESDRPDVRAPLAAQGGAGSDHALDGEVPPPVPPSSQPKKKRGNPAAIPALLVLLILGALAAWQALSDEYAPSTGRGIVSANIVQIAPRVAGRVTEVLVQDNDIVQADQPLLRIDPRPYQLAVQKARENLRKAVQSVSASSASLEAGYARVAQAQARYRNAVTEADRKHKLAARGYASQAAMQSADTSLRSARGDLEAAIAQFKADKKRLGVQGEDNADIRAARLQLEIAEYDLLSTTIYAPNVGVITNMSLSPGQFASTGKAVMTFIDARAVWIMTELRENQIRGVDPGDRASVMFDALPGQMFDAHVESIGWGIDLGRSEQRGLPVNRPVNQWFEPARRMPVRVVLEGNIVDDWPRKAKIGAKAHVLIYAEGAEHPVALAATWAQKALGFFSKFY